MKKFEIAILGAGESGTGAAVLAKLKGYSVWVSDKGTISKKYTDVLSHHAIDFESGKHSRNIILDADLIIKSPGIPDSIPLLSEAAKLGIKVISEIEFAGRYTNARTICITGSNGKTTTSIWTHHILKKAGLDVGLAGNVGQSFAYQVATGDHEYYVLEISSFQLDNMFDFKADIAVLMNITPDHLDRYDYDFSKYVDSKFRIIQNQGKHDHFIYCMDDEVVVNEIKNRNIYSRLYPFSIKEKIDGEGAWADNDKINFNVGSKIFTMTLEELALQGKHNVYNSMAAGVASRLLEIRKETIKDCLSDFQLINTL